ncbi:unnamed protein product [Porites evermanni]|uniref:Uncharacterized protein n=1 Tax=Porites evermanni TaxID=104178 RepID=A0ABN8LG11_9CNID|nr:unnamed protein product [Porites evermanni]
MPLQPFEIGKKPDIRLVVYGDTIYKIKVTCRQSSDRESIRKLCQEEKNHKDLERVVCAILSSDDLTPVQTDSFVIYPYRTRWETREKILFSRHGQTLEAHKYAFTLYVEEKQAGHRPQLGRTSEKDEQSDEAKEPVNVADERMDMPPTSSSTVKVTEYGQKNRHDVEEKDLKEFLRLQKLASEDDEEQTDDSEPQEESPSGLQRVFNALVSPVRTFLGQ